MQASVSSCVDVYRGEWATVVSSIFNFHFCLDLNDLLLQIKLKRLTFLILWTIHSPLVMTPA